MNLKLIAHSAYMAGFRNTDLIVAICIALAESSGNPQAQGDVSLQDDKWGPSVGLWQIRSLREPSEYHYPDTLRIYEELFDPYKNAEAAYAISRHGENFTPWSTYTNNAYRQYLNEVIALVSNNDFKEYDPSNQS